MLLIGPHSAVSPYVPGATSTPSDPRARRHHTHSSPHRDHGVDRNPAPQQIQHTYALSLAMAGREGHRLRLRGRCARTAAPADAATHGAPQEPVQCTGDQRQLRAQERWRGEPGAEGRTGPAGRISERGAGAAAAGAGRRGRCKAAYACARATPRPGHD
jgi:hypothetical protein